MKQIALPLLHFRKAAKQEYSFWKTAIIREFYQNSIDADASRIDFNFKQENGFTILSVQDDGKGMSLETCEDKLLTLGGSDKTSSDIGGFGVAKQILYFAWSKWQIQSHNYKIQGIGCQYEIIHNQPWIQGVVSTIHVEDSEDFNVDQRIHNYLCLCETNIPTYVNGELYSKRSERGTQIRPLDQWAVLYKEESNSSPYISVRVNGMFMFQRYVSGELPCRLTLEIDRTNARTILTSNRDGFSAEYSNLFSRLVEEFSIDTSSAVQTKNEIVLRKFKGEGLTTVSALREQKEQTLETNSSNSTYSTNNHRSNPFPGTVVVLSNDGELKLEGMPDIIVRSIGPIPKIYVPANWTLLTRSMMALWHMTIRQILLDNKIHRTYGIGIVLDPNVLAEYIQHDGCTYFLLNPTKWRNGLPKLSDNKWLLIQELKQRAVHEIGHMLTDSYHNERFMLVTNELEANTWSSESTYKGLAKLRKIKFVL